MNFIIPAQFEDLNTILALNEDLQSTSKAYTRAQIIRGIARQELLKFNDLDNTLAGYIYFDYSFLGEGVIKEFFITPEAMNKKVVTRVFKHIVSRANSEFIYWPIQDNSFYLPIAKHYDFKSNGILYLLEQPTVIFSQTLRKLAVILGLD